MGAWADSWGTSWQVAWGDPAPPREYQEPLHLTLSTGTNRVNISTGVNELTLSEGEGRLNVN